jgi:sporulation protein YlmC with PRC-barrel domain
MKLNKPTQSLLITALCIGAVATINAQSPNQTQPGQNQTGQTDQQPGTHQYTGQEPQSQQGSQYRQDNRLSQDQYRMSSTNQNRTYETTDRSTTSAMSTMGSSVVTKANKASSLIGMDVKNQNGENLGEIKDVVINLNQEKVAYAVMQTGMGIMGTGKLHAVPLRAFQTSADGDHLILNADKDKLARAEGFDKENWPSLNTPAWGAEPFWQDNTTLRGSELRSTEGTRDSQRNRRDSTGTPGTTTR